LLLLTAFDAENLRAESPFPDELIWFNRTDPIGFDIVTTPPFVADISTPIPLPLPPAPPPALTFLPPFLPPLLPPFPLPPMDFC
jgi:hypothetical protein